MLYQGLEYLSFTKWAKELKKHIFFAYSQRMKRCEILQQLKKHQNNNILTGMQNVYTVKQQRSLLLSYLVQISVVMVLAETCILAGGLMVTLNLGKTNFLTSTCNDFL